MAQLLEDIAREMATKAHAGQFRKDGKTPYITHPAAVVDLLKSIGVKDEDVLSSAWLHDTMEDCGLTSESIAAQLNPKVAGIVSALTRDVDRESYKMRIREADYSVQIVKLADFVHNCSTLTRDLPKKTIANKVGDARVFYIKLAESIHPPWVKLIEQYIAPYQ